MAGGPGQSFARGAAQLGRAFAPKPPAPAKPSSKPARIAARPPAPVSHLNLRASPTALPLGMKPAPKLTPSQYQAEQKRGVTPGAHRGILGTLESVVSAPFHAGSDPTFGQRPRGPLPSWAPPAAVAVATPAGPGVAKFGRNAVNDAVANITGLVPGLYHLGAAGVAAAGGNTKPLSDIWQNFQANDPFAQALQGHLAKGADLFYHHPVSALLDVSAGEAVAGRVAGAAARGGSLGADLASKTQLAEPGAKVGDLARAPRQLLGPTTEPTRPYSPELGRRLAQNKPANLAETLPRQVLGKSLGGRLRQNFDQTAGMLESTRRMNRTDAAATRMTADKAARKVSNVAADHGVNLFARGLLADPSKIAADGTPLYRHQLADLIQYHAQPVEGESLGEMQARHNLVSKLTALMQDPKFERNPQAVYKQAASYAKDSTHNQSRLIQYKYLDPQSARVAKLVDPFHFHWRGQQPLVDPQASLEGRSPFSIMVKGQRQDVPVSQVERQLASEHGVNPKNVGFVSNRPFLGDKEQAMAGASYRPNADPARAGIRDFHPRTGGAFVRGLYDPSHEALLRQHLTDQARVDEAAGARHMVGSYALTRQHVADLLAKKVGTISDPQARAEMQSYIDNLRPQPVGPKGGKAPQGSVFFKSHADALEAASRVRDLYPQGTRDFLPLAPGRIAHHFSTAAIKGDLAASLDRLDPNSLHAEAESLAKGDPTGHGLFPSEQEMRAQNPGQVALYHKAVADQYKAYARDTGKQDSGTLRGVSSAFRRANIALSIRHVPGVAQELGIRALTNAIGPVSYMRGRDLLQQADRLGVDPQWLAQNPGAPEALARIKSGFQGTGAQLAQDLSQHIRSNPLPTTRTGAAAEAIKRAAGVPIAGKAAVTVIDRYNRGLTNILRWERNAMEHPAQVAGLGKVATENLKAVTGKNRILAKDWKAAAPDIAKGLYNSPNLQHYLARSQEYWGDWRTASPAMKKTLVAMPFFRWWLNSTRFLLHTLPAHHPIKTGLLSAVNEGTRAWQQQTGVNALPLLGPHPPQALEAAQQGAIPLGNGFVANQQYYTPAGALTPDVVSTLSSLVAPYAVGAFDTLRGYGPFGQQLKDPQGNPIPEGPRTVGKAASDEATEMLPILRDILTATEKPKPGAVASPFQKLTGLPAGVASVLDPLRITKARLQSANESKRAPRRGSSHGSVFGSGSGTGALWHGGSGSSSLW